MNVGIGSYCLVRQKRSGGGYLPSWAVQKRLPGVGKQGKSLLSMESGRKLVLDAAVICPECLAVPAEESPAATRPDCRCQKVLRKFLDKWMAEWRAARVRLIQTEQLEELRNLGRPKRDGLIWEAARVYEERGPETAKKVVQQLRALIEEARGIEAEQARWSMLTKDLIMDWAEMRQEHYRRGWAERGKAPKGAWETLRRDLKEKRLPALDTRSVLPCNTTINTYVRSVKAMFGDASRTKYLRGLDVPELADVRDLSMSLPAPKGHKEIGDEVFEAIWKELAELKETNVRLWVVLQLMIRLGPRPIELERAQSSWLEEMDGVTVLAIKNRPEEGFMVKAGGAGEERYMELTAEVLEVLREVMLPGGSLIGARTKTEAEDLVRRDASLWIRKFVGEDAKFTNYLFRHRSGAVRYTADGKEAAAAGLGHAPGSNATGRYVKYRKVVRALTDEELRGAVAKGG